MQQQMQMPEDPDATRQDTFIVHKVNLGEGQAAKATLLTEEIPHDALFVDAVPGARNTLQILYLVRGRTMFQARRENALRRAFTERREFIEAWIADNFEIEVEGASLPTEIDLTMEELEVVETEYADLKRAEFAAQQAAQEDGLPEGFMEALEEAQKNAVRDDGGASLPGDSEEDSSEESSGEEDIRAALGDEEEGDDNG